MSTNTGRAPRWISGSIVGNAVWLGTMISSPGPNALKLVQQEDDQRPGGAEDALLDAGVGGQFGLERLAFLAEDILAGAKARSAASFDLRSSRNISRMGFFAWVIRERQQSYFNSTA